MGRMKINVIDLSGKVSVQCIASLAECPPGTMIRMWTLQHKDAVEQLKSNGHLTVQPEYSFPDSKQRWKLAAYEWMKGEMQQRIPGYKGELPVWCGLSDSSVSENYDRNTNDILLRVEVPMERALIHFRHGWENVLESFQAIGKDGEFTGSRNPYLVANEADQREVHSKNCRIPSHSKDEYRASWKKIFDLGLATSNGFCWAQGSPLQAVLPLLYLDDVMEFLS